MKGYKKASTFVQNNSALLQGILLSGAFAVLLVFMWYRMDNLLNSDISTQLVLSKLLRDEHSLLSKNWFYSSEIHVLGYNLIFEPLFLLSSSWRIVRFAGQTVMYLLLLLSVWYFCGKVNLRKYYGLIATALIIPYSEQYFAFFLLNINYIPFLSISFLALGMMFEYTHCERKLRKAVLLILSGALAFCAGLGGNRQLYITYAPIIMAILLYGMLCWKREEKERKCRILSFLVISADGLFLNLAGYFINNTLLGSVYDFQIHDTMEWSSFQLDKFAEMLNGLFQNLGMPYGDVFSFAAVHSCVCFILFFVAVYTIHQIIKRIAEVRFESALITLLVISSAFLSLTLYCFTTQPYQARYDLFWTALLYPMLIFYITEHIARESTRIALVILIIGIGICTFHSYGIYAQTDTTRELRAIVAFLEKAGYKNGYATFWQSNVVTELSDGTIEMWDWGDGGGMTSHERPLYWGCGFNGTGDFNCVDKTFRWAQKKAHEYTHPTGKVFWLLRQDQDEVYTLPKKLSDNYVIYRSPYDRTQTRYVVYGFDSYEEMYSIVGGYSFTDRKTIRPHRSIRSNDDVTLYPDSYLMICKGSNLIDCEIQLKYRRSMKQQHPYGVEEYRTTLLATSLERGEDYIVVSFQSDEVLNDFIAEFTNLSNEEATITSIEFTKTT